MITVIREEGEQGGTAAVRGRLGFLRPSILFSVALRWRVWKSRRLGVTSGGGAPGLGSLGNA